MLNRTPFKMSDILRNIENVSNFVLIIFIAQRIWFVKASFLVSFVLIDLFCHIRTVIVHTNA